MSPYARRTGAWTAAVRLALSLSVLLAGLFGTLQAQSASGTITGRIQPPAEDITDSFVREKKLLRYDSHNHAAEPIKPYRLSEIAVVYLEDAPATPSAAPAERPRLNQFQMVFRPLVLAVTAGTTVDFPNSDNLFHNVFSYSQPKEFDLGRYPRGEMKAVRFDKPGIVNVFCDIHAYMYATILVFDHPYFTVPDDDGNFTIAGVPEGRYTLSYWYGRKKLASKRVTVQAGQTTTAAFP
jgi:plastocyanin